MIVPTMSNGKKQIFLVERKSEFDEKRIGSFDELDP
jgi:hypothetical protein